MTEIAQLFESALRNNRANLLRKAAMSTVARMPGTTTLLELLQSEAGAAIRSLTLRELKEALSEAAFKPIVPSGTPPAIVDVSASAPPAGPREPRRFRVSTTDSASWGGESREEKIYRQILDAMSDEPLTIGQLGKRLAIDVDELRGYLNWMKKMGKVGSSGRARATRYHVVR